MKAAPAILSVVLLAAIVVTASPLRAQEEEAPSPQQPIVRVEVTPETVRVGEALSLRVTVLVPTWFPRPPVFPEFELANAITRLPPDSSRPTSSRVDGMSWSGIVRNYQVYPLIAATYRLTDESVRVTYADPQTRLPVEVEVEVPEIEFRGEVPAGAEQLDPYVAGSRLVLSREVEGELDELEAGDAIVVRTTAELEGLPAMFLPTLVGEPEIEGASLYAAQPELSDDGGVARRTEKVTLVFESGGEFELPRIELQWWNTATAEIETASAPPVNVAVAGPVPPPPAPEKPPAAARDWRPIALGVALLVALVWLARRYGPQLKQRWDERRERRLHSEEHAFHQVRNAIRHGEPRAVHDALMVWSTRLGPGLDLSTFVERYGDDALSAELDALSRRLYASGQERPNLGRLGRHLARARERREKALTRGEHLVLPPLNP